VGISRCFAVATVGFCCAVVLPGVVAAVVDVVSTVVSVPVRKTEFVMSKIVYPPVGTLVFKVSNHPLIEGLD
jgi:hypothetical protein